MPGENSPLCVIIVLVLDPFLFVFKTHFFDYDYEHEDDDEEEKQSSIVEIHWWAITTVRKRIHATLGKSAT